MIATNEQPKNGRKKAAKPQGCERCQDIIFEEDEPRPTLDQAMVNMLRPTFEEYMPYFLYSRNLQCPCCDEVLIGGHELVQHLIDEHEMENAERAKQNLFCRHLREGFVGYLQDNDLIEAKHHA